MLHKVLPFALVAIAILSLVGLLFATQRLGLTHPSLDRFIKHPDVPITPEPEA